MPRFHTKTVKNDDGSFGQVNVQFTDEEEKEFDDSAIAEASGRSKQIIRHAILKLETMPRRVRENLIALGTKDQVVIDEDAAIATERGKL